LSIHLSREAGTQAGPKGRSICCSLAKLQNWEKEALDRWSASVAKEVEHLVILLRSTEQPRPAATVEIAMTKVVERAQELLYPFFQMKTEAELSTHMLIGLFLQKENPLDTASRGPTSSRADIARFSFLLEEVALPKLIALDQGRNAHQLLVTAPTPSPHLLGEPPAASV